MAKMDKMVRRRQFPRVCSSMMLYRGKNIDDAVPLSMERKKKG
jgi:hypothetical protein